MIERDAACDQITACFSRGDVHAVITLECFYSFRFNQSQLEIGERFEKRSLALGVAITIQSDSWNSLCLIDGLSRRLGSRSDVDGFNGSGPHIFYAPCGLPEPALRDCSSTMVMHSSRTSIATSASSLVTMSGGAMRTVLGPQPRKRMPRSKASSTMRSRS